MAILTATCATLAATIAAAQPGDVVELPLQPTRCGYVRLNRIRKAQPGVVVRVHPEQRIGLHMTNSSGLAFEGGWWEGAGSDPGRSNTGAYVRWSSNFAFRRGTFGHPDTSTAVGLRILDSTDFEISGIRIAWRTGDAITLSDVQRFRITDNHLTADGARHSTCTYPDGTVVLLISGQRCRAGGGTWRDSTHPDAVQFFNLVRDGLIARNRVLGAQQGIVNFGPTNAESRRVWVLDNVVMTHGYPQGIAVGPAESLIRGNRAGWPPEGPAGDGWGTLINAYPNTLACENVLLRGGNTHPWGSNYSRLCPESLPPAPEAPTWLPAPPLANTVGRLPATR